MSSPLRIDFSEYIPVETLNLKISFTNAKLGMSQSSYLSDLTVTSDDPQALVIIQSDKSLGKMADKTNMLIDIGSNRI